MEIIEDLRKLIEGNMQIFDDDVTFENDDNIFQMGFVNSMFAMKIINFIESEYDIKVLDDDLDINNFSSVNKIAAYVNGKKSNW